MLCLIKITDSESIGFPAYFTDRIFIAYKEFDPLINRSYFIFVDDIKIMEYCIYDNQCIVLEEYNG